MTQQLPSNRNASGIPQQPNNEIDISSIVMNLWDKRTFIASLTLAFMLIGVAYALSVTPVYRANALVQVEEKSGGLPGLSEVSEIFGTESAAVTEIELIKSRKVIGEAVEKEHLDLIITPKHLPFIGKALARRYSSSTGEVAPPFLGLSSYSTGGEKLNISIFSVPDSQLGKTHLLIKGEENQYSLFNENGELILSGSAGIEQEESGYRIYVTELKANPGAEFYVKKSRFLTAVLNYQSQLSATEKGRDSGIISLAIEDEDPQRATNILNVIAGAYLRQNVERQSAEAAKSVDFLRQQLPKIKKDLEAAEQKFNDYQVAVGSVNISAEAEVLLEQIVDIEASVAELQLQQAELDRKYTRDHPVYHAWREQLAEQKSRKAELNERVKGLPSTQQELLGLKRDLEVGTEIYTQMLNNIQELDIVRAGTVGNVRIVDSAAVNVEVPVKPKKQLIVIISTLLGGFLSVAIVLVRAAMNKGVENAEDIENIGLPVYASIPLSEEQRSLDKQNKYRNSLRRVLKNTHPTALLAHENPTDISIESLRSLRTSLHFAMLEAKNNIIMISGPSPTVGKSFVSGNLSAVIAQSGQRVLQIDADMRKGYLHKMFGTSQENGLSDVLAKRVNIDEAIRPTNVGELLVLPRGSIPPNPSELLMTKGLSEVLEYASKNFDLVIVDTPPILAVTDAAIVGHQCGVTLLVTRYGFNPVKEIEHTKKRFEQNGIAVKGAILNAVQRKAAGYGYGYGYYNYHYEYKSEPN